MAPEPPTGPLLAASERVRSAELAAETTLAARESAVLAREQAVELREQTAERHEATLNATDNHRVLAEAQLREANEHLVIASIQAYATTEAAEHAAAQSAIKAERDFLTGLPNRALLNDRFAQSIALAERHCKKVALMFLDLDRFKEINDSLGHPVGDEVLKSIARRLQECLRKSDTVSRQGGDEFLVLLTEVSAVREAGLTAEKLLKDMARPHLIGGHQLHVTLSIGISLYPDDGKDVEGLIAHADIAMYHAKRSGRNTCRRFTPDMLDPVVDRKPGPSNAAPAAQS